MRIMAEQKTQESLSLFARSGGYLRESVDELKKVSRPTRQETIQATIVTVVIICIVAVCLMMLDVIFDQVMSALLAGGVN